MLQGRLLALAVSLLIGAAAAPSATRISILHANVIADGGDTLSLWNTTSGMYYHSDCYFEGWVDYVCPRGWAYITNSRFFGHNLTASIWHDGSKGPHSVARQFRLRHPMRTSAPATPFADCRRSAWFEGPCLGVPRRLVIPSEAGVQASLPFVIPAEGRVGDAGGVCRPYLLMVSLRVLPLMRTLVSVSPVTPSMTSSFATLSKVQSATRMSRTGVCA